MKKAVAISLICMYLFTATELDQLLKLPLLVEHYMEHKEQNKEMTLWKFLCMHYADSNSHHHTDGDNHKDRKLPFKSHDNCISVNFSMYAAEISEGFVFRPVVPVVTEPCVYHEAFNPSSYLANIWQPPRAC